MFDETLAGEEGFSLSGMDRNAATGRFHHFSSGNPVSGFCRVVYIS
jgi:hypothetical protein